MARDSKQVEKGRERYGDVVERLSALVAELERGDLPLEESLERFAEGVQLVKKGEQLLSEAEKRVEQLLGEDGQTRPLEGGAAPSARPAKQRAVATTDDDEDVPF